MRLRMVLGVAAILAAASTAHTVCAQDAGILQKKLNAEFSLTKVTDDRSDIVTAGSVLVLHKDGLVMYSTPTVTPPLNTYRDGRIQQSAAGNYFRGLGGMLRHGGGDTSDLNNIPHRRFVTGEKFWLTGIEIQQDGVLLTVYSDPFNDVRYYGQLKFPFPKNAMPPADSLVKQVEDVVTVQPSDDDKNDKADKGSDPKGAAPAQSASAPAPALAPIAPPPPPSDQPPPAPKTISVGQTKAVVEANWGQPTKVVKLSSKEIYFYPDMKVTFVAGKVSDVQ